MLARRALRSGRRARAFDNESLTRDTRATRTNRQAMVGNPTPRDRRCDANDRSASVSTATPEATENILMFGSVHSVRSVRAVVLGKMRESGADLKKPTRQLT